VRTVWPHEANDFTPWLAKPDNLALLAETLRLGELSNARTEVSVGSFACPTKARTEMQKDAHSDHCAPGGREPALAGALREGWIASLRSQ